MRNTALSSRTGLVQPRAWGPLLLRSGWQGLQIRALGLVGLVSALALAVWFFLSTQEAVALVVGGETVLHRTHQTTVAGVLEELGVELGEQDLVRPELSSSLEGLVRIEIRRAVAVTVEVDGRTVALETLASTFGEVLEEAGIVVGPADRVVLEGGPVVSPGDSLTERLPPLSEGASPLHVRLNPLSLSVMRAVRFEVIDGGVSLPVESRATTVGDALRRARIVFYEEDWVRPDLSAPIFPGLRVNIQRATPLTLESDGQRLETRVLGETVGDALQAEGIALAGKDYTRPATDVPLQEGLVIQVVRVTEEFKVESEAIPFETLWQPDPELELDRRRIAQVGQEGVLRRLIRFVYEDGELTEQTVEREWVAHPPQDHINAYGAKIVWRELETPQGTIRYWRHMRVFASSYTAATSGKTRDHPAYGITRVGWVATKGVIAVDPTVIPLLTRIYVPGYGVGTAADTGGAIKGRIIDLAYDEDKLVRWWWWTDAYLLGPIPPPDKIRWILPDWPPWG
ncbi:MAG: ubiquitin-like domain-containing protein [Anaerolineae bacterium]